MTREEELQYIKQLKRGEQVWHKDLLVTVDGAIEAGWFPVIFPLEDDPSKYGFHYAPVHELRLEGKQHLKKVMKDTFK